MGQRKVQAVTQIQHYPVLGPRNNFHQSDQLPYQIRTLAQWLPSLRLHRPL